MTLELAILIGQIFMKFGPSIAQGYQLITKKITDGETVSQEEWNVFWTLSQEPWVEMKASEAKPISP